ncbi:MAG TPA: YhbY family RNA-binding protein [Bacillota bacterium]|nr:YhbY family RNA-binding protein [Bacillota bacterium]
MFQIGKDGITPALAQSLNDYLVKNELMKVSILDTCPLTLDEAAAEMTGLPAALVQIIGKNIVLYRRNPQLTNGIELPQ